MPTRTLFEITEDLLRLDALLSDLGGDVTDEQLEAEITGWFAELGAERKVKIDNYVMLIAEMEARAEMRAAESERLKALARVDENNARRLRDRLKAHMEACGDTKLETNRFLLSLQKNGGKQRVTILLPVEQLPEFYTETQVTVVPDLDTIRQALEAGEVLDFARLEPRGTSLRIR